MANRKSIHHPQRVKQFVNDILCKFGNKDKFLCENHFIISPMKNKIRRQSLNILELKVDTIRSSKNPNRLTNGNRIIKSQIKGGLLTASMNKIIYRSFDLKPYNTASVSKNSVPHVLFCVSILSIYMNVSFLVNEIVLKDISRNNCLFEIYISQPLICIQMKVENSPLFVNHFSKSLEKNSGLFRNCDIHHISGRYGSIGANLDFDRPALFQPLQCLSNIKDNTDSQCTFGQYLDSDGKEITSLKTSSKISNEIIRGMECSGQMVFPKRAISNCSVVRNSTVLYCSTNLTINYQLKFFSDNMKTDIFKNIFQSCKSEQSDEFASIIDTKISRGRVHFGSTIQEIPYEYFTNQNNFDTVINENGSTTIFFVKELFPHEQFKKSESDVQFLQNSQNNRNKYKRNRLVPRKTIKVFIPVTQHFIVKLFTYGFEEIQYLPEADHQSKSVPISIVGRSGMKDSYCISSLIVLLKNEISKSSLLEWRPLMGDMNFHDSNEGRFSELIKSNECISYFVSTKSITLKKRSKEERRYYIDSKKMDRLQYNPKYDTNSADIIDEILLCEDQMDYMSTDIVSNISEKVTVVENPTKVNCRGLRNEKQKSLDKFSKRVHLTINKMYRTNKYKHIKSMIRIPQISSDLKSSYIVRQVGTQIEIITKGKKTNENRFYNLLGLLVYKLKNEKHSPVSMGVKISRSKKWINNFFKTFCFSVNYIELLNDNFFEILEFINFVENSTFGKIPLEFISHYFYSHLKSTVGKYYIKNNFSQIMDWNSKLKQIINSKLTIKEFFKEVIIKMIYENSKHFWNYNLRSEKFFETPFPEKDNSSYLLKLINLQRPKIKICKRSEERKLTKRNLLSQIDAYSERPIIISVFNHNETNNIKKQLSTKILANLSTHYKNHLSHFLKNTKSKKKLVHRSKYTAIDNNYQHLSPDKNKTNPMQFFQIDPGTQYFENFYSKSSSKWLKSNCKSHRKDIYERNINNKKLKSVTDKGVIRDTMRGIPSIVDSLVMSIDESNFDDIIEDICSRLELPSNKESDTIKVTEYGNDSTYGKLNYSPIENLDYSWKTRLRNYFRLGFLKSDVKDTSEKSKTQTFTDDKKPKSCFSKIRLFYKKKYK